MSDEQNADVLGGWSAFGCAVSADAKKAFTEATHSLLGVEYSPFAMSQQLVTGMNYMFLCNGTPSTLHPVRGLYSVHVFKPPKGPAVLTRIVPLYP